MSGKFDLGDYVDVKERVRLFYAAYPDGRLVTELLEMRADPDAKVRVWGKALAYRTADDPHPGTGWSYMEVPGSTPYTKGSEAENVETSAWGRAIGALGIGIERSIASADEVRAKGGTIKADVERGEDGSLIGILQVGTSATSDFLLRQTPEGPAIGFRLRGDKGGILVRCHGDLAVQLDAFREAAIDARVTCWGRVSDVPATTNPPRKGYQVLDADRVSLPEIGVLPTHAAPAGNEPSEAVVGGHEAESVPLFSAEEQAALDDAMGLIGNTAAGHEHWDPR